MRTVRRLYLYLVAFLSLEVLLWGIIGLAREAADTTTVGGGVQRLATALALLIVGVPVFGVHWGLAQGLARREAEERAAPTRALFLYAVLLATLIPCVQNLLALFTRALLYRLALPVHLAWVGGQQTWLDNLIALFLNALTAAVFWQLLRAEWKQLDQIQAFADVRRLYRYTWLFYSLLLLIVGVQQMLRSVLLISQVEPLTYTATVASGVNGLALASTGASLWAYIWLTIQRSLADEGERQSLLRLAVLYLLSLAGISSVLTSGAMVVHWLLRLLLGEAMTMAAWLEKVATPISVGVALGGLWGYYGNVLTRTLREVSDAPQRAAMRRLYFYILSAAGLTATFLGLNLLLRFVLYTLWADVLGTIGALRSDLAAALATLLVSLPLWWLTWRPMQGEAMVAGEAGDHARRSVTRKAYLYLALFAGVVGGMVATGMLIYLLLLVVLGQPPADLTVRVLGSLRLLALFALLGGYHALALRHDGRLAEAVLTERQAAFPVLILDPEDGFASRLAAAIRAQAPGVPVILAPLSQNVAVEGEPRAVLLPADVAFTLPASWRKWLAEFPGYRLMIPRTQGQWIWSSGTLSDDLVLRYTAQTLRLLAEGRPGRAFGIPSVWLIGLSIFGVLFLLQLLFGLLMSGVSMLLD